MTSLYLCGAGNCEAVRLALAINRKENRWDRIVLLDDDETKRKNRVLGVKVVGPFSSLEDADPESSEIVNLVAKTTVGRWSAQRRLESYKLPFASLVSPDVDVSGVDLAGHVIIYQNVVIGPMSSVGQDSVIFMGAVLGNGSRMARGSVLGPNAAINARVKLENGAYIGTNAAVLPDANVGAWATVGMCSAVLRSVPAGTTVMGVPAKTVITLDQRLKLSSPANLPLEIRRELESLTRKPPNWSDSHGKLPANP